MDTLFRWLRRQGLIALALVLPCVAYANGTMPNVVPVNVQPLGAASGGGVLTRVTYEMRLAEAANAGAGVAANAASYVARPVAISGPTMGGILAGVVRGGSKLVPYIGAALTAYEVYKWINDASGNLVTSPVSVPPSPCAKGGSYWQASWGGKGVYGCSLPGVSAALKSLILSNYSGWSMAGWSCDYLDGTVAVARCYGALVDPSGIPRDRQFFYSPYFVETGAPEGVSDPGYNIPSRPVTNQELGDLAQQHPEWWPDMLRDPQTGQPLITPEIADDMDALKHQIAPRYGVDPETLPHTQPDPDYVHGNATPREQSLPGYCAWASAACDYYKFVQDQWPDKKHKIDPDNGCGSPMPACSGDAVLCAIAANTRATKCGAGDDTPPDNDPGKRRVDELIQPDVDVGDTSRLDSSGFGWGTACPFNDLQIEMGGQTVTVSVKPVCDYGPWMRAFILILAGLQCARIMAGLKDADGA